MRGCVSRQKFMSKRANFCAPMDGSKNEHELVLSSLGYAIKIYGANTNGWSGHCPFSTA